MPIRPVPTPTVEMGFLDPDARRRLVRVAAYAIGAWTPIFVPALFLVGPWWAWRVALACGGAILLVPTLLRRTGSVRLAANLLLLALAAVCGTSGLLPGGSNGAFWWLTSVPVIAGVLMGRRAALAWLAVFVCEVSVLLVASGRGGRDVALLDFVGMVGLAAVLLSITWLYESARLRAMAAIEDKNRQLEAAAANIRELQGLLVICMHCHSVRVSEEASWERVETYIGRHGDVQFSHGVCPTCLQKYYPEG